MYETYRNLSFTCTKRNQIKDKMEENFHKCKLSTPIQTDLAFPPLDSFIFAITKFIMAVLMPH